MHFSEEHISAPTGCCAPKFLHALENDQFLLAHPPPETGAPLTTFFKGGSKIGLKCNKGALITSELALDAPLGRGDNARTTFEGTAPPLKFGRTKNVQNLVRFTTTFEFDREYL